MFSMSEAAISAETVAILKAKDAGSTAGLSAALQTVIDQKSQRWRIIFQTSFRLWIKSSVKVNGNYVYLVISDQADAINQIIQAGNPVGAGGEIWFSAVFHFYFSFFLFVCFSIMQFRVYHAFCMVNILMLWGSQRIFQGEVDIGFHCRMEFYWFSA